MPDGAPQSPYYSERPVFLPSPAADRRPRLEGNRVLLVLSIVILVAATAAGFVYIRNPRPSAQTTINPPALPEIQP
jgi:hypothetical protein